VSSEPSTEALALFAMSWLSRLTPLGPIIDPGAPFVDGETEVAVIL